MGNRIRFVCRFFSGRKNLFSLFFFSPLSENVFVVHWHVEKHTPEERWTDGGLIPSGSASSLRIWWERKIYERFMERDFSVKTFAGWFQRNTLDGVIYAYKHMTEEHHFATLNGSDTGSKSNRTTNPTAHNHSSKKGRKIHSWSGKIDYRRKSFEFDPLFFQHIQSRDFHSIVLWTRFLYEKVELILNFRIWRFRDILKETHR